jgi:hypothetical protein
MILAGPVSRKGAGRPAPFLLTPAFAVSLCAPGISSGRRHFAVSGLRWARSGSRAFAGRRPFSLCRNSSHCRAYAVLPLLEKRAHWFARGYRAPFGLCEVLLRLRGPSAFAGYCDQHRAYAVLPLPGDALNVSRAFAGRGTGGGPLAFIVTAANAGPTPCCHHRGAMLTSSNAFAGRVSPETAHAPERTPRTADTAKRRRPEDIPGAHRGTAQAGVTGKGAGTPAPFPVTGPASTIFARLAQGTGAVSS